MIVELIVGAGLVVAGAAAARILVRRREAGDGDTDEKKDEKKNEKKTGESTKSAATRALGKMMKKGKRATPERIGPRGLRVGDVLLYEDTELWLAGCIELEEEGFVARLFISPGSKRAEWVAQLDDEGKDVAALMETSDIPGGPVPESLPVDGRRLSLERRGAADVVTRGEHLPRTAERASYTILSDAGGRVLVVVDFVKAPRLALAGERISNHMIDLLPGGDLED